MTPSNPCGSIEVGETKEVKTMTLEEAIEIKTIWKKDNYPPPLADEINADNLGIEALKCIQKLRTYEYFGYPTKLPGETKD